MSVPEGQPSLIYVIGRVDQGVRRELRVRLAPLALSVPDVTTLSVLRGRSGLSNAQLARRALITPQSMLEVLASLEQRGLLARRPDAANARIMRAERAAAAAIRSRRVAALRCASCRKGGLRPRRAVNG